LALFFHKICRKRKCSLVLITVKTRDLRFSQGCWGRVLWDVNPGDCHIVTDVSERPNASIFTSSCPELKCGSTMFPRNAGNYLTVDRL
jgi:hypothetical protein